MAELSSNDIKHLINDYEAQVRRLQFELDQAKLMVRTLKSSLSSVLEREKEESITALASVAEAQQASLEVAEPPKKKSTKGRGRPRKQKASTPAETETAEVATASKKKRTKKKSAKKSTGRRAYRLSEYDQYLYDCLNERGTATITSEFASYIMEVKQAKGEPITEEEALKMIARSLQKLANRRDDFVKVPYDGRGKAYALPEWMRGGKLMSKHSRS